MPKYQRNVMPSSREKTDSYTKISTQFKFKNKIPTDCIK